MIKEYIIVGSKQHTVISILLNKLYPGIDLHVFAYDPKAICPDKINFFATIETWVLQIWKTKLNSQGIFFRSIHRM